MEDKAAKSLRLLIDQSSDPMVVHRDGVVIYANEGISRFVGPRRVLGLIGSSIDNYISPDDRGSAHVRLGELRELGDSSVASQMHSPDEFGKMRVVETRSTLICWNGEDAIVTSFKDLSGGETSAEMRERANIIDVISDAVVSVSAQGFILSWNKAATDIYGWERTQALGRRYPDMLGFTLAEDLSEITNQRVDATHHGKDGSPIPVRISLTPSPNGGAVLVISDMTELEQESNSRLALFDRHAAVVSSLSEGIMVANAEGVVESCNEAAKRILNRDEDYIIGRNVIDFDHEVSTPEGDRIEDSARPMYKLLHNGEEVTDLTVEIDDNGHTRWLSITTRALRHTPTSAPYAVVCSFSDITSEWRALEHLQHTATHDSLTGLPNRASTTREINLRRQNGEDVAVFFIDLDSFKMVNDSLGHEAGDQVLTQVATRMRKALNDDTFLGRLGGDEFVGVTNGTDTRRVEHVIENILKALEEPIELDKQQLVVTASVGVAFSSADDLRSDLLRDADIAMYAAKSGGKNRSMHFDAYMLDDAAKSLLVREELRQALSAKEVNPYYQPISRAKDGKIIGYEALARWERSDGTITNPSEFISVAESSGLILDLGRSILRRACHDIAEARKESGEDLHVAVNLSAQQFVDERIIELVKDTLGENELPASALWLEITESMLMDNNKVTRETLLALRDLGVHLSIDDFGTGYSSLAYLQKFPVSALKIDKSFVDGMLEQKEDQAIVRSVLTLAHNLDLQVVAEGVEDDEQLQMLKDLDCDLIQGYLVGRPSPVMVTN